MAIAANSLIEFFGTQDALDGTATLAINDAAFSVIDAADGMNSWTNDDDAPMASVTLKVDYATAPTANSGISLYARILNVNSTFDNEAPDANFTHTYLGRFPVNNPSTSDQYITIDISLPNAYTSTEYEFYIENSTGQTIQAGWEFWITPKTYGPHA